MKETGTAMTRSSLIMLSLILILAGGDVYCQSLRTIAGGGFGEDGPATMAALVAPRRVVRDASGEIYIADAIMNRVLRVDATGTIHLVAGNGLQTGAIDGEGDNPLDDLGDGGPAVDATFWDISGLTFDASGRLHISDTSNGRIRRIGLDGIINTVAGDGDLVLPTGDVGDGGPAVDAHLSTPRGIHIDANGYLYIADSANQRIRMVSGDGIIQTLVGDGNAGFGGDNGPAADALLKNPSDIDVDGNGRVYIADTGNNRIRAFSPGGNIDTVAGGGIFPASNNIDPKLAQLNSPAAVVVGPNNDLFYLAESLGHRVRQVLLPPFNTIKMVAGTGSPGYNGDGIGFVAKEAQLDNPQDVWLNSGGGYLIADTDNGRVRIVDGSPFGFINTIAGAGSSSVGTGDGGEAIAGSLNKPNGVVGGPSGEIYIADTSNHRVRKLTPDGIIEAFAGNGTAGTGGDAGPATAAQLATPAGMAIGADGSVYIADRAAHRVRCVAPDGVITTFAGSSIGSSGDGGSATVAKMNGPSGLAFDNEGNLYIADAANNKIRVVDATGDIHTFAGTGAPGSGGVGGDRLSVLLTQPEDVAVAPDGLVYIADTGNNRILKVSATGTVTLAASDQAGSVFLVDIDKPTSIIFDWQGNLYIANSGMQQVIMGDILPFGSAFPLAGSAGMAGFNGDLFTNASDALLSRPYGVALDATGNLIIADRDNNRIRRIDIGFPRGDVDGNGSVNYADVLLLADMVGESTISILPQNPPFSLLDRANMKQDNTIDTGDLEEMHDAFKKR
jgi:sugar lactone lactonase YvrE